MKQNRKKKLKFKGKSSNLKSQSSKVKKRFSIQTGAIPYRGTTRQLILTKCGEAHSPRKN